MTEKLSRWRALAEKETRADPDNLTWHTPEGYPYELSTMPGFAGSSAYYLRYMDPKNDKGLVSTEANEYWENVDLYIGGTEHATGHLVYSRFWNKFLFDLGYVCKKEPFKKEKRWNFFFLFSFFLFFTVLFHFLSSRSI